MKRSRILSAVLCAAMLLSLCVTGAAAAKEGGIQEVVVSMTEPQVGKPLPTDIKVVSPSDVVLERYVWSSDGNTKVMEQGAGYSLHLSFVIKPGSEAYFHLSSVKARVNEKSGNCAVSRQAEASVNLFYYVEKPNPAENYKPGVASAENYDTFDYRAYANVYPDLKKAYGYDAAKLYAHYVNFGKAEGRVGTFITGDNPKANAPIYGIVPGTNELKSGVDINSYAVVPATLLDYEPPKKTSQLDNWRLNQRTSKWWMSNAKLVAECYHTDAYMGDNWGGSLSTEAVEVWTKFTLPEELDARITAVRDVYDYEHGIERFGLTESDYKASKAGAAYQRASCSDTTILLHCYDYMRGKSTFAAPPADPGTPGNPPAKTVGGFSDVTEKDYFADPVIWAVEKKITSGTGGGKFSPGQTCTQAQILTFLWRAKGSPEPAGTAALPGVEAGAYYYKAALWAKEQGMIGDEFAAGAPCTRAMAVTYLWKQAGSPAAPAASFTDVPSGADYAQAVAWAVEQKVTSGTGNNQFSPSRTCTRGQIATFLYRTFAK